MQRLSNFCKMRHHIRAHCHVLTNKLAWTYGQTRSFGTVIPAVDHRRPSPLYTLNPENLSSGHVPRNISGCFHVSYTIQTRGTFLGGVAIRYATLGRRYLPFPDNTLGFLYYKAPEPGNPDYSGSLRFRVVSGTGSYSFADGVDLKLPTGGIWKVHLYTATRTLRLVGFVLKLVEEGLVTASVVEGLRALPYILLQNTSQILYQLEDPFVARLHRVESLVAMSKDNVQSGQIMPMFLDSRMAIERYPYKGTVFARFERSTLREHADTRTIVLRILEALTPIECVLKDYDYHIAMPSPGNLLSGRYQKKGSDPCLQPWSANLDTGKGKATDMISLLWPRYPGRI